MWGLPLGASNRQDHLIPVSPGELELIIVRLKFLDPGCAPCRPQTQQGFFAKPEQSRRQALHNIASSQVSSG